MKKLISLFLALAMVFSLSVPAFATEATGDNTTQDVTASYTPVITISDVVLSGDSVAVDTDNKTYTITIPADQTEVIINISVSGQNLDKLPNDGSYLIDWTTSFYDSLSSISYNEENGNLEYGCYVRAASVGSRALKYSTDGGTNWTDTGWNVVIQQAEPEPDTTATITGVSLSGTGVTYDETTKTYTVAKDATTVFLTVTGTNLQNGTQDNCVLYADGAGVYVTSDLFTFSEDGTTATSKYGFYADTFASSSNFEIKYSNDGQQSWTNTGIYVTYDDGSTTTYDVNIAEVENGTVSADKQTAAADETVTLTVNPSNGYELDNLTVTYGDDNTAVTVTNNTFTMPAGDVTVSATFKKISYTVTVNTAENGAVSADKQTAAEGDTVTLTVTPNADYQIGTVTVTDAEGNTVAFTETGVASGTYTFTMPASNVTVEATFTAIEKTSADISWGSLAYTYTDEAGEWSAGTAEGAGTVTVTNNGTTEITATPAYEASTTEFGTITSSFDVTSANLGEGESQTFKLSLDGTPTKAIPEGTKIGTVTVTITETTTSE